MKNFTLITLIISLLLLGSCCSKKGSCPVLQFESIELINFKAADVKDSVNLIRYDASSNFTVALDTTYLSAVPTDDTNKFKVHTQALSINYHYGLQLVKLGRLYRISGFTGDKVACGKCFMRPNNQFGYILSGYSVNNRWQEYNGIVQILK